MLRFARHRPSQNSAVSTRWHAMGGRDIFGRVHASVPPVPTRHTYESRVALAMLRGDVLVGITGLPGTGSLEVLDLPGCLLLEPAREQVPTRLQDVPARAGLLCDVPVWLSDRSPSGSGHGLDVEVLDPDRVEPGGKVGAGLLNPVLAPRTIPGLQPGDQGPGLPVAIDADDPPVAGRRDRSGDHSQRDMSAVSLVGADAARLSPGARTSQPGATPLRRVAGSGPRHSAPDQAAARPYPPSRTTPPTKNDQTRHRLLPARKDRVLDPGQR